MVYTQPDFVSHTSDLSIAHTGLAYTVLAWLAKPLKKSASFLMPSMRCAAAHLDFDTSIAFHGACSVAGPSLFIFFRVCLLLGVRAQLLLHDQLPPPPRGQLPKDLPEVLGYLLHTQRLSAISG